MNKNNNQIKVTIIVDFDFTEKEASNHNRIKDIQKINKAMLKIFYLTNKNKDKK
jgi:hypothetical protein